VSNLANVTCASLIRLISVFRHILAPGAFEVTFYLNGSGESGYDVSDKLISMVVDKLDSYVTPPHGEKPML
jgi:hypothetical protein